MSNQDVQLDRNPSPDSEAKDFESADERIENGKRQHELALLDRNQGTLGRFLGTTNTNLKIASVVVLISGTGLIISLVAIAVTDFPIEIVQLCGTILLTVAGYIFGVKSSD